MRDWVDSETRYIVECDKRGYFKAGDSGSMWYNDSDFVTDALRAQHYKTQDRAITAGMKLILDKDDVRYRINVVPIIIAVDVECNGVHSVNDGMDIKLKEARDLVASVKALSEEDTDALSQKKWREFLASKRYVRDYGRF